MKRMIPTKLIDWVKSLFHRVAPGEGDGDVQIGGNLEVDGSIKWGQSWVLTGSDYPFQVDNGDLFALIYNSNNRISAGYAHEPYGDENGLYVAYDDQSDGYSVVLDPRGLYGFTTWSEKYTIITLTDGNIDIGDDAVQDINITGNVKIKKNGITLGETNLTEAQLQKLIALIPAE